MSLGKKIAEARAAAELSIRSLAEAVRCSAAHLSRVESGHTAPGAKLVRRIARRLAIPEDDLMMLAGKMPPDVERWLLTRPEEVRRLRGRMARAS
jgi:putative DNA methylase